jgi:phosphate butyryltransferase
MVKDFDSLVKKALSLGQKRIAIGAADDSEVIAAVREAAALGLASSILVGDEEAIRDKAGREGLPEGSRIVDIKDSYQAALEATRFVRSGEADILVKGSINTSDFLKAALDKEKGLRSGRLLSHLAAFELPGEPRLQFHSDGGMNVAPELEEKRQILENALEALHRLGIAEPRVAILAANEQVNPKIRATTDAAALVELWRKGGFPGSIVEGPMALDVATSAEAAARKGLSSAIVGEVDLFIMPSIEAGNIAGKLLVRYAGARMAGLVLGALRPIVLVSRADDAAAKVNSLALACLARG